MSYLGDVQPFEDDTAASLVRREGFPPIGAYNQMPEVHDCVCCRAINPGQEGAGGLRTLKDEKEIDRRKRMQLDIFDERARPINPHTARSGKSKNTAAQNAALLMSEDPFANSRPPVPLPPPTVADLARNKAPYQQPSELTSDSKLVVTVHTGKNIQTGAKDPLSVLVRCGAFEGQTLKVPRGKSSACTWDELFEFPYSNPNEPLEVLVLDDALPEENDHLLGGVVVPAQVLNDRQRGTEEVIPILPEDEMQAGFDKGGETALGTIVMSWYISDGGRSIQEPVDLEKQSLEEATVCTFAVHRVFQYTDNGSEPFLNGVLCVLRDTEDNCSPSILFEPGSQRGTTTCGDFEHEGFHYLPENPSQVLQLQTQKKLGHILICVPSESPEDDGDDEEDAKGDLIVIGAVPLDFERLYHRGSATLLVESKSKSDAVWGEMVVEWVNRPEDLEEPTVVEEADLIHVGEDDAQRAIEDGEDGENGERGLYDENAENGEYPGENDNEEQGRDSGLVGDEHGGEEDAKPDEINSIFATVVHGLNLTDSTGRPVQTAQVVLTTGDMEGATMEAPNEAEDDNTHTVVWNQEVRFIDVEDDQNTLYVTVKEEGNVVSVGECDVPEDEGVCIVKMHSPEDLESDLGEITITYKKYHGAFEEEEQPYDEAAEDGKEGAEDENELYGQEDENARRALREDDDEEREENDSWRELGDDDEVNRQEDQDDEQYGKQDEENEEAYNAHGSDDANRDRDEEDEEEVKEVHEGEEEEDANNKEHDGEDGEEDNNNNDEDQDQWRELGDDEENQEDGEDENANKNRDGEEENDEEQQQEEEEDQLESREVHDDDEDQHGEQDEEEEPREDEGSDAHNDEDANKHHEEEEHNRELAEEEEEANNKHEGEEEEENNNKEDEDQWRELGDDEEDEDANKNRDAHEGEEGEDGEEPREDEGYDNHNDEEIYKNEGEDHQDRDAHDGEENQEGGEEDNNKEDQWRELGDDEENHEGEEEDANKNRGEEGEDEEEAREDEGYDARNDEEMYKNEGEDHQDRDVHDGEENQEGGEEDEDADKNRDAHDGEEDDEGAREDEGYDAHNDEEMYKNEEEDANKKEHDGEDGEEDNNNNDEDQDQWRELGDDEENKEDGEDEDANKNRDGEDENEEGAHHDGNEEGQGEDEDYNAAGDDEANKHHGDDDGADGAEDEDANNNNKEGGDNEDQYRELGDDEDAYNNGEEANPREGHGYGEGDDAAYGEGDDHGAGGAHGDSEFDEGDRHGAGEGENPFQDDYDNEEESEMAPRPQRKRPNWKRRGNEEPQVWYPPGNARAEAHIPLERRPSMTKQLNRIRELERQSRIAEESVRRMSEQRSARMGVESRQSRSTSRTPGNNTHRNSNSGQTEM